MYLNSKIEQMDSDSESDMSSVTDISIYHEFDQMISELHSIQQLHEQSIQHFQHISSITNDSNNDNIIITYDKKKMDLDELLESIYSESEARLKGGEMKFGELLLEKLEKCSFNN